ncbi:MULTISPECIES: lytic transglycosylase domain-containing protein [Bosea]|uniref:lytic transglycosylase domain-containing protein n=1 Tax=Bosea TaxID=85413 RepID=UPI0020BD8648|nr:MULTISPECIES: lytic transglycosylase domain-containing protein [Bosea]
MPISPVPPQAAGSDRAGGAAPCATDKPLSSEDARALVTRVATEEDFYPDFVLSVAKTESRFNSVAVSEKGAFGLMQLMPATAKRFKVDLCDPTGNVLGGVRFLRALHQKYRNPFYILAAYNAGEDAVEKNRGVPAFPETIRYVAEVINDFYALPAPGRTAARTSSSKATAQAAWNDGFVMHID